MCGCGDRLEKLEFDNHGKLALFGEEQFMTLAEEFGIPDEEETMELPLWANSPRKVSKEPTVGPNLANYTHTARSKIP